MNIRSLIISLSVIIGLTSCGGDVALETKSSIEAPSTMVAPADSNGEVTFNLINDISYPSDVSPTYTWFFGDGSDPVTSTIPLMNHEFSENKDYEVRVQITDQNGNAAGKIVTLIVKVTNAVVKDVAFTLPSTLITPTVGANGVVTIDASNIMIPSSSSAQYLWDFGDDNTGSTSIGLAQHKYTANGSYTVTLTLKDSNNKAPTISTTYNVIVDNIDESSFSVFIGYSSDAQNPLSLTFNSVSENLVNTPATYSWNFGDNQTSDLENPTNNFAQAGNYNVELTVTDSVGEVKTTQRMIVVSNIPNVAPVAMIGQMDTYFNEITVSAVGSSDEEGASLTYAWNFGDGKVIMGDEVETHTYASVGDFVVTLTVSDGELEHSVTADVTTEEKTRQNLIEKSINSFITSEGGSSFPCSNCHYPTGPAKDGDLDFKVGASTDVTSVSVENGLADWLQAGGQNNFMNPVNGGILGTHLIVFKSDTPEKAYQTKMWNDLVDAMVLYVEDLNNQENTKPEAVISSAFDSGTTYLFNASESSDPEDDGLIYSWDFGDSSPLDTTINPSHTFEVGARYTVVLTVSDGELSDTASVEISTKVELVGDPVKGETSYAEQCAMCHEGDDDLVYGEGTANVEKIAINRYLNHQADLFDKIDGSMPPEPNSGNCVDQCAADIEAFMMGWEREEIATSCENPSKTQYGSRQLKLLTVDEYANSVKDILGFEVDKTKLSENFKIYEFDNHSKTEVDFNRLLGYQAAAESISKQLFNDKFSTVVGMETCIDDNNCADIFVGEALTRLFRREISPAESVSYVSLFNNEDYATNADSRDGLKLAIRTALMSPNFLYRSEQGMTKTEYEAYNAELSIPVELNFTVFESTAFKQYGQDLAGGNTIGAYQKANISYSFTGNDLLKVNLNAQSPGHNSATISVGELIIWEGVTEAMEEIEVVYSGDSGSFDLNIKAGNTDAILGEVSIAAAPVIPTLLDVPDVEDGVYVLTPAEMATYIAYSYTGSTPDDILIAAAIANELSTDAQVRAQIERLLETDKAKAHFGEFAAQWFTTDAVLNAAKDGFPEYTDDVKSAMAQEVREIFNDVMFNDDVPFSALYDSNYTFVNEVLADFYGIGGVTGDEFVQAATSQRGGIVTSGALLSAWTAPTESKLILRGVRIRERLLCQHFPPFPSNVDLGAIRDQQQAIVDAKKEEEGGLIRQAHLDYINTDLEACASCHEYIINPLGVGLEDFDAVGLPRTKYASNNLDVDFTGYIAELDTHQSALYGISDIYETSERIAFQGAKQLGQILGTGGAQEQAQKCMIEMGFRYMTGSGTNAFSFESETYRLSDEAIQDNICASESMLNTLNTTSSPKEAFINLSLSDMVRYRKEGYILGSVEAN
ncbi:PKD domain-containing protein [Marinicellulosiphila megalodicopiae]|uniref:PKD domain-containing protein n=1 Tax=Marinicellulosiphila megalodicopiae TaxID=2724896 RepID=UPI003BAF5F17